jgi:hypothetical protein
MAGKDEKDKVKHRAACALELLSPMPGGLII